MPKLPPPKATKLEAKDKVQMQSAEELSQLNPYYKKIIEDVNNRVKKFGLGLSEEDRGLTVENLASIVGEKMISSP